MLLPVLILVSAGLIASLIIKSVQKKSLRTSLKILAICWAGYLLLWMICFFGSTYVVVAQGTPVCFDDWCATVTETETLRAIGKEKAVHEFIVVHLKMSNAAKGRSQKPDSPRVYLVDASGKKYSPSTAGLSALNHTRGKQAALDSRLELGQQVETQIVFDAIISDHRDLKILIEEGSFMANFELWGDKKVFQVK